MDFKEIFTLCFFLTDNKVLLAMKKRGFGKDKWNGYGGKVGIKQGESIESAAVREIFEESNLSVQESKLEKVGLVRFSFDKKPKPEFFECHVFMAREWKGDPVETEEMRPEWYPINNLPFNEMWAGDCKWIPLVLSGKKIKARVDFDSEGSKLNNFTWEEADFSS